MYCDYSTSIDDNARDAIVIVEEKVVAQTAVGNTHTTVAWVTSPRTAAAAQVIIDGLDLGLVHGVIRLV